MFKINGFSYVLEAVEVFHCSCHVFCLVAILINNDAMEFSVVVIPNDVLPLTIFVVVLGQNLTVIGLR